MKRFSVGVARQRFSHLLDAAERGEGVVIERRGIQFELKPRKPPQRTPRASMIEWSDPAVARGQWTWASGPKGVTFTARKSKR